ncbi:MAG: hypothetical protein IT167_29705 [Bryobacterales bacterium]|nr:hypothetical protein [Bryobacterales bacterium]
MNRKRIAVGQLASDLDFALELRDAVEQYLRAVDSWEAAYRQSARAPSGLPAEHHAYTEAHQRLMPLLPRARALSMKFGLRDPWSGLLHTTLGQSAPQLLAPSAIGLNERAAITDCLSLLVDACWEEEHAGASSGPQKRSWLRGILDRFRF